MVLRTRLALDSYNSPLCSLYALTIQGGGGALIQGDHEGGGHLYRVIRGEGVTYTGVLPMHKCHVGRVVIWSWWWSDSFPASSFYARYARLMS